MERGGETGDTSCATVPRMMRGGHGNEAVIKK